MKADLPEELSGYKRERSTESRGRVISHFLGLLVLAGLVGIPAFFMLKHPDLGIISLVVALAASVGLIILQNKKRTRKCPECRQAMEIIDAPWPAEAYTGTKKKYPGVLMGADGNVYYARSRRSTTGSSGAIVLYTIERFLQRWCACHACRVCFLSNEIARNDDELFKTQDSKKWKQAQELIKTDPNAVTEKGLSREMSS